MNKSAEGDDGVNVYIDRYVNRPEFELYDYAADPLEVNNLIDQPKYRAVAEELKRELKRWMKQQADTGLDMDIPFERKM